MNEHLYQTARVMDSDKLPKLFKLLIESCLTLSESWSYYYMADSKFQMPGTKCFEFQVNKKTIKAGKSKTPTIVIEESRPNSVTYLNPTLLGG